MTPKEEIDELLEQAKKAILDAVELADETQTGFTFDIPASPINVGRKMGGGYFPKGSKICSEDAYYLGSRYDGYFDPDFAPKIEEDIDLRENQKNWREDSYIKEVTLSEGIWEAWQSSSESC